VLRYERMYDPARRICGEKSSNLLGRAIPAYSPPLEHDPEKFEAVFRKIMLNNLKRDGDST
jgi:hypothetical protein